MHPTRIAVRSLALNAGFGLVQCPRHLSGSFQAYAKNLHSRLHDVPQQRSEEAAIIIESIEDRSGRTIYKASRAELRCITLEVAYVMNELLREVIKERNSDSCSLHSQA